VDGTHQNWLVTANRDIDAMLSITGGNTLHLGRSSTLS